MKDNETIYGYLCRTSKFIGKTYGDTYKNISALRLQMGLDDKVSCGTIIGTYDY